MPGRFKSFALRVLVTVYQDLSLSRKVELRTIGDRLPGVVECELARNENATLPEYRKCSLPHERPTGSALFRSRFRSELLPGKVREPVSACCAPCRWTSGSCPILWSSRAAPHYCKFLTPRRLNRTVRRWA